jgi:amidase
MDARELAYAGIARQAELIRAGEVSSRELVEVHLGRIRALEADLNAFRVVRWERALEEADAADARRGRGDEAPLLGVPVAVKDNVDVGGELTTHGTGAYGGPATSDAEIVRRLRLAGAVIAGKTQLPELAMWGMTESSTWGVTRNPWDTTRTPGGSSGGSAAAVAAALVPAASGSDSAGSIRIPAASCGLFGLKPQRGRISLAPLPEHWFGLSVLGCLSRTVLDTGLWLDAVSGPAPGDADVAPPPRRPFADEARSPPGRLRFAVSLKPPIPATVESEIAAAVHDTADLLRGLGHEFAGERDPDYGTVGTRSLLPRYLRGIHEEAAALPHPKRLERRTRGLARLGLLIPARAPRRAKAAVGSHADRINAVFDHCDVLVTPALAKLTPPVLDLEGRGTIRTITEQWRRYPFTGPWNALGQPAAAVPAGFTPDGLPLSVQLVGRPNDEATLLSLAAQIEAERQWADRRPPVDE